jgi:hypothetical protein
MLMEAPGAPYFQTEEQLERFIEDHMVDHLESETLLSLTRLLP